jgi:hypothetical protein
MTDSMCSPLLPPPRILRYSARMTRPQQTVVFVLGLILIATAVTRVFPPAYRTPEEDILPSSACIGEPLVVDFPYLGTVNEPWTCKVQCEDGKRRYILYSNGKATQCQDPPGCNDTGEDTGVTCIPPTAFGSSDMATPVTRVE